MQGTVSRLCDIHSIAIPVDMLQIHIDEHCADNAIRQLSLRYAAESCETTVQEGDTAFCRAEAGTYEDNRTVLLFTGVALPGAEKANKAVIGSHIGNTVDTVLGGKPVRLTVEKIIHRTPAAVDNNLIATLGIDNVETVDAYKAHILEKALADAQDERCKEINRFMVDKLLENSSFEYDEAEMDREAQAAIDSFVAEYGEEGLGESAEGAKQSFADNVKLEWLAEAFCREHGLSVDSASVEEETDRMLEIMSLTGEPVPNRDELIQETLQREYVSQLFSYIETLAKQKMGE